ncbi:MAG: hypothetical protein ABI193_24840 [Minicystis sp.]
MHPLRTTLLLTALLFRAAPTLAQTSPAQTLLDDGVALMDAGKTAEACPKIAESLRLEPGMKPQFRLAQCYEKLGKTASAWKLYLDVITMAHRANRPDREELARKSAEALEPTLARVLLVVPPTVSSLGELMIKIDGAAVEKGAWEKGVPLDPGEHVVTVTAAGHKAWSEKKGVKASARVVVKVPVLEEESPKVIGATMPPRASPPVETATKKRSLVPGIALGATAIAGFGAGVALLIVSSAKASDATRLSDDTIGPGGCSRAAPDLRCAEVRDLAHGADTLHNAAVGALIGGSILAAGAATYLIWSTRKAPISSEPSHASASFEIRAILVVNVGRGGVSVSGTF